MQAWRRCSSARPARTAHRPHCQTFGDSMIGALLYLQFRSTANQFVSRIKRLKKPKYLAGFLVGGFYFYFYFFRTLLFPSRRSAGAVPTELTPDILAGLEPVGAALLFIIVLFKW